MGRLWAVTLLGNLAGGWGIAWLIMQAGGQLFHCVLDSILMVAALIAGAPFGYLDWLGALGFSVLGNVVGGVGIVAFLRLARVPQRIAEERRRAD